MIKAGRILATANELLDGVRIEELPIPFTAVATDLTSRREVWMQRGPVSTAIRASIAIPSLIAPIVVHGRLLADGGPVVACTSMDFHRAGEMIDLGRRLTTEALDSAGH